MLSSSGVMFMVLICNVLGFVRPRLSRLPFRNRSKQLVLLTTRLALAALLSAMAGPVVAAQTQTATSTSLALTSGGQVVSSVAAGSVVTLTAKVVASGNAVNPGQVNFCDATAKTCSDIHLLGTAQLTAAGTATLRLRPGIGSPNYKAVFLGTNSFAGSASNASALRVTGTIPQLSTQTTINQAGSWGGYTLSATVTETGNPAAPTGSVSFLDTNHANAVLGTGTLGAATRGVSWSTVSTNASGVAAVSYATADLNGDGIPDLFAKDYFGNYEVLLGKGDGTFAAVGSAFGPTSQNGPFIIGDFNNDGIPDVGAINAVYLAPNNTITIFLGKGDGTFTVAATSPAIGYNPTAIATADVNGDGNADLIVDQQESQTSGNGQIAIFFGNGDGTFTPTSTPTALSSVVNSVIPADINGDGKIDLVLGGNGSSGIDILLGKGDGTFTAIAGPTSAGGANVAVADINNDGIPDLIFPAAITSYLTVFLGNGDGTFSEAPSSPNVNVKLGNSFTIADLDLDGVPDIVYAIPNATTGGTLLGKGDGSFVPTPATFTLQLYFSGPLIVADFNGDGWPDALWIDGGGRTVQDSLNLPTETASASATVSLPAPGTHLADASYQGDSRYKASTSGTLPLWGAPPATTTSLTIASSGTTVSSVAPGTVITLSATVNAGASPVTAGQVNFCDASAPACSDIHLVGTVALSAAGVAAFKFVPGPGTHSYRAVFIENGSGLSSSSGSAPLTVGPAPPAVYSDASSLSVGGYTGDYSLTATVIGFGGTAPPTGDVSFIDTSFSNTNLGTATLGSASPGTGWIMSQTPSIGDNLVSEVTGDFNQDGIPDLAILWSSSIYGGPYSITILTGKGDGTFSTGISIATGVNSSIAPSMITGDFNGDGKADIVVLSADYSYTSSVTVFAGNGDGTFGSPQTSVANVQPITGGDVYAGMMTAADFNGDGKLDLALAGNCVNACGITILLGHGDGTFTPAGSTLAPTSDLGLIAAGDFNGDGIPDLAATNYFVFGGSPTIFLGKGDGTFTANLTSFTLEYFPKSIVVGDFNEDGVLDLAFSGLNGVQIALGNGDGTFKETSASPIAVPSELYSLQVGDFNHDGKLDLAGIDNYNDRIVLLIGAGDGTFTVTATTPAVGELGYSPFAAVAADFSEDGVPDLVVLLKNQATATILATEPTQTATATLTGVAPVGAGTHNVEASYLGDSHYPAVISATAALDAGLKPVTITPTGGTFSSVQTVTMTEAIPGATIYYLASGVFNTAGYVPYTGPISLSTGGIESISAYASETGYFPSTTTTVTFNLNFPKAPAPVISPSGGVFAGPQTVTITDSAPGVTIYYTTDGTSPSVNSTVYSGPITVSTSGTIAAIAASGGYSPGPSVNAQFFIQSSQSRFIYTVAGNGFWGFSGDGGPAVLATLNSPGSTAMDGVGNLYIADTGNHLVRKVSAATGIISTVAGTGVGGYSGDGGAATSAELDFPQAIAIDSSGNLFINDQGNRAIRRVDAASGIITTYAGSTTASALGDGGPATDAKLYYPQGIAIDSAGNLYIGDQTRVRMVTASTGIINTVAGSGFSGFSGDGGPATNAFLAGVEGLAIDKSGNLFIADTWNSAIRKVTAATGIITTVAGQGGYNAGGYSGDGGPATSAKLYDPMGVAVDSAGNLYIADTYNYVLREVTAADGNINTISGHPRWCTTLSGDGGPAAESGLCWDTGVTVDSQGNVYVAESEGRVRKLTLATAPPGTATAAPTFSLAAGTYNTAQNLTMTDATPGAQIFVSVNGEVPAPVGQSYFRPIGIASSATIQAVAVAPGYLPSNIVTAAYTITSVPPTIISTYAGNGTTVASGIGGPAVATGLAYPTGIAFDGQGNLYIADQNEAVVWKVSAATGNISVAAGIPGVHAYVLPAGPAASTALGFPQQLAVDKAGNLYISDSNFEAVLKVDASTGMMAVFAGGVPPGTLGDGGPATQASIYPNSLGFDKAGDLYIADGNNGRIRKVSLATGIITTVAGGGLNGLGDGGPATSATLSYPGSVVFDSKGNLYIGEQNGGRVRVVDAQTGIITTFAGNGDNGATGDGGAAIAAEISASGLAVDSSDNLYLSNSVDGIRMVPAGGGTITRVVGIGYNGFSGDGGAASMAELCAPAGLAFDKAGYLFIADSCNYRVRRVGPATPAATPALSLAAGTYTKAQTLAITDATPGASIYYTTDGSTPGTASTLYTGPIAVSSSETFQAIAVASGYTASAVASANYVIDARTAPGMGAVNSSANPSIAGTPVTFTVSVSSSVASPSGTVTFSDGTAQLGTGTLSNGLATYTTSALAAGSHSISAVYSGDSQFAPVTSAALTQDVVTFTIAPASGSSSTATAPPGGQAKFTLAVNPPAGSALTFSIGGLPAGATATFSPSTLAAGAGATTVTLTVSLPASAAVQGFERPYGRGIAPLSLGLMLLPLAGGIRKRWRARLSLLLFAVANLTIGATITGCGGSSSQPHASPQTYTLTVTATSGKLTQTTTLTLTVQP
ncbi:hypothetical protein DYQ86_22370 [Acidobacteria bacterium AB60]|nr:hypothetical protein DYQ86_22370 [Acidobacteria bacterium AB60]